MCAEMLVFVAVVATACVDTSLAPFAGGSLTFQGDELCDTAYDAELVLTAGDGTCASLDSAARWFFDGEEGAFDTLGGQTTALFDPERGPRPSSICEGATAFVPFASYGGEHEARVMLDDEVIVARFVLPDTILACEGVAFCNLLSERADPPCPP